MGLVLAVLVLAALSVGFVALMALPLFFIGLAVSVFREPWATAAPEAAPAAEPKQVLQPQPPTLPEEAFVERPRAMAAGRRRPLR
jgi:hypothetical protein